MNPNAVTNIDVPLSPRTLANRQNALKSTGPRTLAGKQRVAMNAFKHGLSGQSLCLRADESVPYFDLAVRYIEDLRPVGVREEQFAQKIIDGNWRLNRIAAIENNLLNQDTVREADRITSNDDRGVAMTAQAEAWRADCAGPRALETLGRHEGRIARTLFKMTAEFDALQTKRLKRDKDVDTFVKSESRAWRFVSDALTRYRAEESAQEAHEAANAQAQADAEAAAQAQAEISPDPTPESPQPVPIKPTSTLALNWQTTPECTKPAPYVSRASARNQALRAFAASIGQPFPVFTGDEDED